MDSSHFSVSVALCASFAALRSAHKSYTYNKNAAYEEELRRDEQRRLLRRVCKAGPQEEAPADNSKSSPAPELDDPPPVEEEAEPTAEEGKSKAKRVPRLKRITRKRRGLNLCDLDVIGRKRKYNIHRKRGLRRFRVGVAESTAPAQLSNGNDDQVYYRSFHSSNIDHFTYIPSL